MKRFLYPATYLGALLCIAIGACGFLLLKFLPPSANMVWILPLFSFLVGFLLLAKIRHFEYATLAALLIFSSAWGVSHFVWPRGGTLAQSSGEYSAHTDLHSTRISLAPRYRSGAFSQNRSLRAPVGTTITVFRNSLRGVRWIVFSPSGKLFASLPRSGEVVQLVDDDRDGYAEQVQIIASGLDYPHGLAFAGDDLLVAGEKTLYRLVDADHRAVPPVKVLSNDLPGGGGHATRSVVVDRQGNIYLSAGSSCNVCEETDPRRATVRIILPGDEQIKPYARGLRNTVGMAIHPQTGRLWGSDNGRDMLGDDLPADEINLITAGQDYGWPYCYGEQRPDPEYNLRKRCAETVPPAVSLPAHSAPLGITFGERLDAPVWLQNSLLVAYHGSWNRTEPTGYKLVAIPFSQGQPSGEAIDLLSGWLDHGEAWGRPVSLAVGPDGALYVSDDRAHVVYRIQFHTEDKE